VDARVPFPSGSQPPMEGGRVPELTYGPRVPWHRRRAWRRFRLWGRIIILVLLVSAWCVERGPKMFWYYRCLTYIAPPDQIVYDDDPPGAASLRAGGRPWWMSGFARPGPEALGHLGPGPLPTLLLHGRECPNGSDKLARITVLRHHDRPNGYYLELMHQTYAWPSPVPMARFPALPSACGLFVPVGKRLRLFAGQPDDEDTTRFTIGYELGGVPGMLEGRLLDDGTVQIRVRDGPAAIATGPPQSWP
jgi:hypothetical protein